MDVECKQHRGACRVAAGSIDVIFVAELGAVILKRKKFVVLWI